MPNNNPSVAIIGAGTSLVTASMIQDGINTFVINDTDRLGGHIHTIVLRIIQKTVGGVVKEPEYAITEWTPGDIADLRLKKKIETFGSGADECTQVTHTIALEAGAEFIGDEESYPTVHVLLKQLGVTLEPFLLDVEIQDVQKSSSLILPPIPVKEKSSSCSFFCCSQSTRDRLTMATDTIARHFPMLIQFARTIKRSLELDTNAKKAMTFSEFAELFIHDDLAKGVPAPDMLKDSRRTFINDVLYVEVMAAYGVDRKAAGDKVAYDALNWLALGLNWFRALTGLSHYMHEVKNKCDKSTFITGRKVVKIEVGAVTAPDNSDRQYKVKLSDNTYVCEPGTERPKLFKYVMIGTPAEVTKELLPDLDENDLRQLKEAFAKVTSYTTHLQFHRDQRFVSKAGTAGFIQYDSVKDTATLNPSKPFLYEEGLEPVVKSWIQKDQNPELKPQGQILYEIPNYRHPYINNAFRDLQLAVQNFQGKYGIFILGLPAGFNDSHEAALEANLQAAWKLAKTENFSEDALKRLKASPMPVYQPKFTAEQLGAEPVDCCSC